MLLLLLKKFLRMSFLFHKVLFFSWFLWGQPRICLLLFWIHSSVPGPKLLWGISDRQRRGSYLNCLAWKGKLFSVLITSTESWRHLTLSNSDTSSSLLGTKLLLAGHEKMKISRHSITVFSSHFIVKNCTEEVWLNSRTFSFAACCCPRMDNYHF